RGPSESTLTLALSRDGQLLATGNGDGSVYLWDIRTDPEQRWVFVPDPASPERELARHRREAEEAEKAGQWFAAAWHLDWLLRQEPDSASLRARRDRARGGAQGAADGPAAAAAVQGRRGTGGRAAQGPGHEQQLPPGTAGHDLVPGRAVERRQPAVWPA